MDDKILEILKDIQGDIKNIQVDIKDLKTQVSENTQILKALEHSSEVNEAEHGKM